MVSFKEKGKETLQSSYTLLRVPYLYFITFPFSLLPCLSFEFVFFGETEIYLEARIIFRMSKGEETRVEKERIVGFLKVRRMDLFDILIGYNIDWSLPSILL